MRLLHHLLPWEFIRSGHRFEGSFPTGRAWDGNLSLLKKGAAVPLVLGWGHVCVFPWLRFSQTRHTLGVERLLQILQRLTSHSLQESALHLSPTRNAQALLHPLQGCACALFRGQFLERGSAHCTCWFGCAFRGRGAQWSRVIRD